MRARIDEPPYTALPPGKLPDYPKLTSPMSLQYSELSELSCYVEADLAAISYHSVYKSSI
ncbi:hypothetical protein NBRC116587_12790 [Pseudoteredinibacter isoporae]